MSTDWFCCFVQFQCFSIYRCKVNKKSEDEISFLRSNPKVNLQSYWCINISQGNSSYNPTDIHVYTIISQGNSSHNPTDILSNISQGNSSYNPTDIFRDISPGNSSYNPTAKCTEYLVTYPKVTLLTILLIYLVMCLIWSWTPFLTSTQFLWNKIYCGIIKICGKPIIWMLILCMLMEIKFDRLISVIIARSHNTCHGWRRWKLSHHKF